VAACFYVPFVADWCEPGLGLQQAAMALGELPGVSHPWFWSGIVRFVGRNVSWLGTVSMVSAFVNVLLVAALAGLLVDAALREMRRRVSLSDEEADGLRRRAEFLTSLAFVLTPGFFRAATHVSPLHSLLIPFLVGLLFLALLIRLLTTGEDSPTERLKRGFGLMLLILAFLLYAGCEMILSMRFLQSEKAAFAVFAAIGVFPLAVLSHFMRRRVLLTPSAYGRFFFVWTLLIAGFGILSVSTVNRGRVASRVVRHVLDNARTCRAVVSDGGLDLMFYFMLPDDQRLILLSRDGDIEYGRNLSDWIRKSCGDLPNLFSAAEHGPRALVDQWASLEDEALRDVILTPARYFPTLARWREACAEISGMDDREPCGAYLKSLLGESGNRIGNQCLETGMIAPAWKVFWEVVNRVDAGNRTALVRLSEIREKGYPASKKEQERLAQLCETVELNQNDRELPLPAAPAGGRDVRKENVELGTLAASRCDHRGAEHYFRQALPGGRDGQEVAAKGLAFALTCQGRADEAEPYARQAVALNPDDWSCREALAYVLIRQGRADEGECELRQAIQLAKQSGVKSAGVIRFSLDCAWLHKFRGERAKMTRRLRVLSERGDLTAPQRQEIKEIEK